MSVNSKKYVSFELDGVGVTGLTPTVNIKDVTSNQMIVISKNMTEDTDIAGTYYYNVSGFEGHEYMMYVNAGTNSVDKRVQILNFTLVDENAYTGARYNSGGYSGESSISLKAIESLLNPLVKEVSDLKKQLDDYKSEGKKDFEFLLQFIIDNKPETDEKDDQIESFRTVLNEKNDEIIEILKSDEGRDLSEDIRSGFSLISSEFIDFFSTLEIRKNELLGNDSMKNIVAQTFSDYMKFKNKK